jgi:hypothetical protein
LTQAWFFPLMMVPVFPSKIKVRNCLVAELTASFLAWVASPEAAFLKGKFVWANWDVEELIAKKEELESSLQLIIGLLGSP